MQTTNKRRKVMGCLTINRKKYSVFKGLNTIGRNKNATIIIHDPSVSQHHAIITVVDESQHFLSELESTNGTFLGNTKLGKLEMYELDSNSIIKFADVSAAYLKKNIGEALEDFKCTQNTTCTESFLMGATQILNDTHEEESSFNFRKPQASKDNKQTEQQHCEELFFLPTQKINDAPMSVEVINDPVIHDINDESTQIVEYNDIHLASTQILNYDIHDAPTQFITVKDVSDDNVETSLSNILGNKPSQSAENMSETVTKTTSEENIPKVSAIQGIAAHVNDEKSNESTDTQLYTEAATQIVTDDIYDTATQFITSKDASEDADEPLKPAENVTEAVTEESIPKLSIALQDKEKSNDSTPMQADMQLYTQGDTQLLTDDIHDVVTVKDVKAEASCSKEVSLSKNLLDIHDNKPSQSVENAAVTKTSAEIDLTKNLLDIQNNKPSQSAENISEAVSKTIVQEPISKESVSLQNVSALINDDNSNDSIDFMTMQATSNSYESPVESASENCRIEHKFKSIVDQEKPQTSDEQSDSEIIVEKRKLKPIESDEESCSEVFVKHKAVKPIESDEETDERHKELKAQSPKSGQVLNNNDSGSETDLEDDLEIKGPTAKFDASADTSTFINKPDPEEEFDQSVLAEEYVNQSEISNIGDGSTIIAESFINSTLNDSDIIPMTQPIRPNFSGNIQSLETLKSSNEDKEKSVFFPIETVENIFDESTIIDDVDDAVFMNPTQVVIAPKGIEDEDSVLTPTQALERMFDDSTTDNNECVNDSVYDNPTQVIELHNKQDTSIDESLNESLLLRISQKFNESVTSDLEENEKSEQERNEDAMFMQATQQLEDKDIFDHVTQVVAQNPADLKKSKFREKSESSLIAAEHNSIFLETTQIVDEETEISMNANESVNKMQICRKKRSNLTTIKVLDEETTETDDNSNAEADKMRSLENTRKSCLAENSSLFLEATQIVEEDNQLNSSCDKQTKSDEVESQLEVLFASQLVANVDEQFLRPTNPIANIIEKHTLPEVIDTAAGCSAKTRSGTKKRLSSCSPVGETNKKFKTLDKIVPNSPEITNSTAANIKVPKTRNATKKSLNKDEVTIPGKAFIKNDAKANSKLITTIVQMKENIVATQSETNVPRRTSRRRDATETCPGKNSIVPEESVKEEVGSRTKRTSKRQRNVAAFAAKDENRNTVIENNTPTTEAIEMAQESSNADLGLKRTKMATKRAATRKTDVETDIAAQTPSAKDEEKASNITKRSARTVKKNVPNVNVEKGQAKQLNVALKNAGNLSTPERAKRKLKHKIVFTMLDIPELNTIIKHLGGSVVEDLNSGTVLVTGCVKRSQKLLQAVGNGIPICPPAWLYESQKAAEFLDPWNFILTDAEAEKKWKFSLNESLSRSSQSKLFQGYAFQIFATATAEVLKAAIEACGGKCVSRLPANSSKLKFLGIATSQERNKFAKLLKQNPPVLVVAPEAIFDGVLRQELNFEKHAVL